MTEEEWKGCRAILEKWESSAKSAIEVLDVLPDDINVPGLSADVDDGIVMDWGVDYSQPPSRFFMVSLEVDGSRLHWSVCTPNMVSDGHCTGPQLPTELINAIREVQ